LYDYPKLGGLTKRKNYKIKTAKINKNYAYPLAYFSFFHKQLIPISIDICKLFSCTSKPTHALLASKRGLIGLQKMLF
jgi:hypothetical protein